MAVPHALKIPPRFSFAHAARTGTPFPVPLTVYDETISVLQTAVHKSKLGNTEKADAIKKLHEISVRAEKDFIADESETSFNALLQKERDDSYKYNGKTVFGDAKPSRRSKGVQPGCFDLRIRHSFSTDTTSGRKFFSIAAYPGTSAL